VYIHVNDNPNNSFFESLQKMLFEMQLSKYYHKSYAVIFLTILDIEYYCLFVHDGINNWDGFVQFWLDLSFFLFYAGILNFLVAKKSCYYGITDISTYTKDKEL
jgi:hypothetical protein